EHPASASATTTGAKRRMPPPQERAILLAFVLSLVVLVALILVEVLVLAFLVLFLIIIGRRRGRRRRVVDGADLAVLLLSLPLLAVLFELVVQCLSRRPEDPGGLSAVALGHRERGQDQPPFVVAERVGRPQRDLGLLDRDVLADRPRQRLDPDPSVRREDEC